MRHFVLLATLATVCGCQVMPLQEAADGSKEQEIVTKEQDQEIVIKEQEQEIVAKEVESEPEYPTLWEMTSPESHIDAEEWCVHYGNYIQGNDIQVLQVVEEFADEKGIKHYFMICTPRRDCYNRMTIGVVSRHAYVTSEMLRPGNYMYLKPYSYKNKIGDDRTIRMYLENPRENELTEEERAELADEENGEDN